MGERENKDTKFKPGNRAASKYKAEYAERLIEFFGKPLTRTEYKEVLGKDGEVTKRIPMVVLNDYPTFEVFAAELGVTTDTLRNWAGKYKPFGRAYDMAKQLQRGKLIAGTMGGLYNAQFAKFEAVNNHGMTERVVSDGKMDVEIKMVDELGEEGG